MEVIFNNNANKKNKKDEKRATELGTREVGTALGEKGHVQKSSCIRARTLPSILTGENGGLQQKVAEA